MFLALWILDQLPILFSLLTNYLHTTIQHRHSAACIHTYCTILAVHTSSVHAQFIEYTHMHHTCIPAVDIAPPFYV